MSINLAENLARIQKDIQHLSPYPEKVKVIAVTKQFPLSVIQHAVSLGIKDIGESRIQEALEKFDQDSLPGVTRHFIGSIQFNKVQKLVDNFHWLHSLDTFKVARKLYEKESTLNICLQVNTSGEKTKHGLRPNDVQEFVHLLQKETPTLRIWGLMTIGPLTHDENKIRGAFRCLREIGESLRAFETETFSFQEYSMGMTGDYKIALQEGATMLRIGEGIFGPRSEAL
ncbi:MAG: YggS family pyridoxal phosphate-dependent enzyme [Candidatus Marinimicrobia bacterium]|nr:YggS family pyridoxal phosphate-dependent enzyme [Candidatus Neomarinimicrobiota bacterium]MDD5582780.1 YggS family pyridoxal phosphate-dependent enzyme [Candidatus Neomarinimicrobiota bacterium]